jgi:hypothetical protein
MQLALAPQTERCFLSLTSALSAVRTGCLVGNSSVGKRQTLAQLTQACGQHLQDCYSHLNYQTVSWYIKGLASSGSWLLFDKMKMKIKTKMELKMKKKNKLKMKMKTKEKLKMKTKNKLKMKMKTKKKFKMKMIK